jgi:hypothetical protein
MFFNDIPLMGTGLGLDSKSFGGTVICRFMIYLPIYLSLFLSRYLSHPTGLFFNPTLLMANA